MTDHDYHKLRINNRIVLRYNLDRDAGLYNGAHGTITDLIYFNPNQLDRGVKSVIIQLDNVDGQHIINGIKSEDFPLYASYMICDRSLIFPLCFEHDISPYHMQ